MRTLKSTASASSTGMVVDLEASAPTSSSAMQRSPWHSPVPYLFGGLAAMLGLIAFALLILACSYWKLSGQLNGENNNNGDDLESGDDDDDENEKKKKKKKCKDGKGGVVFEEEQFVVIMAGDHKPTCLAMPVECSRSSAKLFNSSTESDHGSDDVKAAVAVDESVKVELEMEEEEEELDVHHQRRQSDEEAECNQQLHLHHHHHHHQNQTELEPAESSSSSS